LRRGQNNGTRFEKYEVEKRPRSDRCHGLWEYRVSEKKEEAA
jgi:hypothetical protein